MTTAAKEALERIWLNRGFQSDYDLLLASLTHPTAPEVENNILHSLSNGSHQETAAFERWAKSVGCDMSKHPLHYLFLKSETYQVRQGWKAALEYSVNTITAATQKGK
jgi:hypothetical protein